MNDNIYKASKFTEKVDYQKVMRDSGEQIEVISFYKVSERVISNPPDHKETIDQLLQVLRGTGISQVTITFLDKNLEQTEAQQ